MVTSTLLLELLELAAVAAGAVSLSVVGAYVEWFALGAVQHGEPKLGLWAAVMGAAVLYFAYAVATRALPRRLNDVRTGDDTAP